MRKLLGTLLATLSLVALGTAQFYSPPKGVVPGSGRIPSAAPASIRIDQRLGAVISPDIEFTDSTGVKRTTGELFSKRPAILLMVFYKCTGVCTIELQNLQKTLRGLKKDDAGKLYDLVVVSIDQDETPELAAIKKEEFLKVYNREGTEDGFHFMVGDKKNIDRLADEVGFRFYQDPESMAITHPAGIMVISPQRMVTRYFLDQEYQARPLLESLKDARDEKIGVRDDRPFFMACINVDPLTGQRSLNVMNTVKTGFVATVIVMLASIILMNRNPKYKRVPLNKETADLDPNGQATEEKN